MRMVPQARWSQDDGGVTHTHPAPQEQQPQVEQEQEPTDEEPVNDPASSGLEWSSDKHLPTSDELIELSKEQQEAGFELSSALCTTSTRGCRSTVQSKSSFFRTACLQSSADPSAPNHQARHVMA